MPGNNISKVVLPATPLYDASKLPESVEVKIGEHNYNLPVRLYEEPQREVIAFTRSQIERMTPSERAANTEAISKAEAMGFVVDDVTDPEVRDRYNKASAASAERMLSAIRVRDARLESSEAQKAHNSALADFDYTKRFGNEYEQRTAEQRVIDTKTAWSDAVTQLTELTSPPAAEATNG